MLRIFIVHKLFETFRYQRLFALFGYQSPRLDLNLGRPRHAHCLGVPSSLAIYCQSPDGLLWRKVAQLSGDLLVRKTAEATNLRCDLNLLRDEDLDNVALQGRPEYGKRRADGSQVDLDGSKDDGNAAVPTRVQCRVGPGPGSSDADETEDSENVHTGESQVS